MAIVWTIGIVILLVGFRLLLPPVPAFARYAQRMGKRTSLALLTAAFAGAALLIFLTKP